MKVEFHYITIRIVITIIVSNEFSITIIIVLHLLMLLTTMKKTQHLLSPAMYVHCYYVVIYS